MNQLTSSFSLYETLRLLIPGFYLSSLGLRIAFCLSILNNSGQSSLSASILFIVVSVALGLLIYSFDFPKTFNRKFRSELPTLKLKEQFSNANRTVIENYYFLFYDNLSGEFKQKTEIYSGLYHLAFSLLVCSVIIIILVIPITIFMGGLEKELIVVASVLLFSMVSVYNLYSRRLKGTFQRQLLLFYKSDEFKKFKRDYLNEI